MAVVHSKHRLSLRVYEMREDLGQHTFFPNMQGTSTARRVGDAVELGEGQNEVDDAFWAKWIEQNKDGLLITSGALREEKKEESHEQPENARAEGA